MTEPAVEVTVPVTEPDTGSDDTIVVVAPPPVDTGSDNDLDVGLSIGRLEERVTALEGRIPALESDVAIAESEASTALTIAADADAAIADVEDALLDVAEETVPDLIPELLNVEDIVEDAVPEKPHPVHRSFSELFRKSDR